jgi:hypothetical protein
MSYKKPWRPFTQLDAATSPESISSSSSSKSSTPGTAFKAESISSSSDKSKSDEVMVLGTPPQISPIKPPNFDEAGENEPPGYFEEEQSMSVSVPSGEGESAAMEEEEEEEEEIVNEMEEESIEYCLECHEPINGPSQHMCTKLEDTGGLVENSEQGTPTKEDGKIESCYGKTGILGK